MTEQEHAHPFGGEDSGYSLLYPFVVCASNGGPYDDRAFVAGVNFGRIDTDLAALPPEYHIYVDPGLVRQLDLLAMHHGYALTTEPWDEHPEDWTLATFRRADLHPLPCKQPDCTWHQEAAP